VVNNPEEIISMVVCKEVLYIATRSSVYAKDGNGIWQELPLPVKEGMDSATFLRHEKVKYA